MCMIKMIKNICQGLDSPHVLAESAVGYIQLTSYLRTHLYEQAQDKYKHTHKTGH